MEPFDFNAETLGQAFLPAIFSLPGFVKNNMLKLLAAQDVTDLQTENWYPVKSILDFYAQVIENYGPNTIFDLGKAIPENAVFPPGIDSIGNGLGLIDTAYNMNHRNGYLGFYKLVSHDEAEKKIVMQCYNPYPCDFDRGLLTSMARKFKLGVRVMVDESKPSKKKGDLESWYIVSYR
ncbi:hypothetical protein [Aureispira anguillae]|uniref:Uncharacterized protein n=1 Tax=Aureispira anguillae TaxID=2864201 RepID=A0A915YG13_9BACT|nr:hypothetical protein [Aureispira anguillae]BDS12464.1 hypothetical protein AsAng_0031870 [Aureispira anguillae]